MDGPKKKKKKEEVVVVEEEQGSAEKADPKGKAFKKGKADKQTMESDGDAAEGVTKAVGKNPDAKLALRTKIIARKRMMRKKKATLRSGK